MGKIPCAALVLWILAPPDALRPFEEAVAAYVALHRDVERQLPRVEISPDSREIQRAVDAMAAAMRAARPRAEEGDLFTPAAGDRLRRRIRAALLASGDDPADILSSMTGDEPVPPDTPLPAVNGRFSWALPSFMVASALEALPPLPEELEYRFVGRDLVLIDLHANLVVDILRDGFPDHVNPAVAYAYMKA